MAENKTINIKINSNTKEATKDTQDYNKAIGSTKKQYDAVLKSGDSYEKQLSDINKIVKETPLNVRDMNKQIQAYQSIALSAGRETPVGKEALQKASELRDRYIDIQNETKRLADDQKNLQGAIQLVGTGVAAFGGVQSAMALSGVESEKLRETMVKLQAAQTLMNSINTIATALEKESSAMLLLKSARTKALTVAQTIYTAVTGKATKATKLFKVALASTGIGLLVVGIGLLIANFDKLLVPMKAAIDGLKAFGDAIGLTNFAEEKRAAEQKKRHEEFKKQQEERINLFEKEIGILKFRDEKIQKSYDTEIKLRKAAGKDFSDIEEAKLKSTVVTEAGILKQRIEKLNEFKKQGKTLMVAIATEQAKAQLDVVKNAQADLKILENNNLKERADNYKNYLQNRLNAARKIEDIENSLMEDGIEKDLEINRDKFRRLQEDAKKNTKLTAKERRELNDLYTEQEEQSEAKIREKYDKIERDREKKRLENIAKQNNDFLDTIAEIEEQNYQNTLSDEERELRAVQDKYFALEEAAQGNADALLEIEIARLNAENEIYLKYDEERDAAQKVRDDKAKADAKALQDAKIDIAVQGLQLISGIADAFAGDDVKRQKKAFQIKKVADIASATVDGYRAVLSTYAQTPGGPVLKGIAAGIAGGFASLQIANIAKQQFEGGGGDIQEPTDTGGAGGGEAVAPSFNVVGDSGINQIAQLQQTPVQAFVVSGEVTTSQALDRNRVQNATL